jgi:FkbM family methyltransferase
MNANKCRSDSPWVLRMKFNKDKMNAYGLRMIDIYTKLNKAYNKYIDCVYSDDNADECIFRIKLSDYALKDIDSKDEIAAIKAMEHNIVYQVLLKGIKGINKVSLNKTKYDIYNAEEEKFENITYVNSENLKNLIKTTAFHTIIVSRYLNFYEFYPDFSAYQTFIWGHDIDLYTYGANLSVIDVLTKWSSKITGCVCQTEWHKNRYLSLYPQLEGKITTINNGIQSELFKSENKKGLNRFIYSSCSERGLSKLIQLWPRILENLPDAKLVISSYNSFPNSEEDHKILEYIQKTPSIRHVGRLNKEQLYTLMSIAEYWLYPSYFPETSCITSLEMLASEVICLYYPVAGLVNTIGDYGIPIAEGNEIETLLDLSVKRKNDLKKKGRDYALNCSWKNRAVEWCNMIFSTNFQNKLISDIEERMFYLYETISMPYEHVNVLSKISKEFTPNVIYDIGASTLHWTKEARKIWDNSDIYAFDVIEEAEKLYKSQNIKYNIGVLSDSDNKMIKFYENKNNPAGNSYYKEIGHPKSHIVYPEENHSMKIAMTLETIVKKNNYNLPDLVKIDVQGAELDILKGGMNIINHAKYLIIELQHVEYNRGAPLANTTIDFLNKSGWEIVEEKFSNNGPDADYLFINKNYVKTT